MAILDAEADSVPIMPERHDQLADLFETYAPAIRHFFSRRGFSPEDCRDLTQDTFLKAHQGLGTFREQADLRTWLLAIAANVWKNDLRSRQAAKRAAVKTVSLDDTVVEAAPPEDAPASVGPRQPPSPLQTVLKQEGRRRLRAAIDELPPRMRQCVLLRVERGLKYREVAAILQVSVDTVKTQLHQARQRLREALGDEWLQDDDLQEHR